MSLVHFLTGPNFDPVGSFNGPVPDQLFIVSGSIIDPAHLIVKREKTFERISVF
jgi:hypothetical protein